MFRLHPELKFTRVDLTPQEKKAIDAETFRGVLHCWSRKDSEVDKKDVQAARDHYAAEFDRLLAKVRLDEAIHEPIQVDDKGRLLKGFRRFDAALKLADEGHPVILDSLRVEQVSGFADDYEIRTYLRAGTLSVKTPTRSERRALIADEIGQDEVRYESEKKLGEEEAFRSSYNLIAARLGVSYHLVSKVEQESFPARWHAYETGQERRLDTNGVAKAKRDRESPSAVQAIANLFGGTSTETLDTLTLDKLEDTYALREKDLDPKFVTDAEISKVQASYEFLKEEIEKRRSTETKSKEQEKGKKSPPTDKGKDEPKDGDTDKSKDQGGGSPTEQQAAKEWREGATGGESSSESETLSWLTDDAIAEMREEVDRFAEERAAIEDYFARGDRPFTAGLLSALMDEALIEVEEVDGKHVIRDWTQGDLRDFGEIVASLSPLEPALREIGVTPQIARKHLAAMIEEAQGFSRREPEPEPETKPKRRKLSKSTK